MIFGRTEGQERGRLPWQQGKSYVSLDEYPEFWAGKKESLVNFEVYKALKNHCGDGESRTRVQRKHEYAFYMLSQ